MNPAIPVTVIGGYLGAGKTTLVNHLLRAASEPIAVLVNDFGSVNIDEELITTTAGDTIALTNGCICCSLADGFSAALETVLAADRAPARIVIEASGVADPATVAAYGHRPGLTLDGIIVLADAEQITRLLTDRYVGDTVAGQLRGADLVVLTKCDLADDATTAAASTAIRRHNPVAPVIEATAGTVDLGAILGLEHRPRNHATPEDASHVFGSIALSIDAPLRRGDLERALDERDRDIVRVKGIVSLDGEGPGSWVVQCVGGRREVHPGASRHVGPSRLVAIGLIDAIATDTVLRGLAGQATRSAADGD